MSALEELENELFETLVDIRAGERRVEKLKMQIRTLKPDFVDLDIIDVIRKPLSEQLDPITRAQAEKQEEFKN